MRRPTPVVLLLLASPLIPSVARAQGDADNVPKAQENQSSQESEAEADVATARATVPPVPQFRGGTLGIPEASGKGVLGLISGQTNLEAFNANVFAKIGRLELTAKTAVDIVGETFSFAAPYAEFVPGNRPLPLVQGVQVTTLGFRLRWRPARRRVHRDAFSTCIGAVAQNRDGSSKWDKQLRACKELGLDPSDVQSRFKREPITVYNEAWARQKALEDAGWIVLPGIRFLYSGSPGDNGAAGIAGELAIQYIAFGGAIFASGSVVWLNGTTAEDNGVVRFREPVTELRGTVGLYRQFIAVTKADSQVLPRIGAYVTVSRNYWQNEFAAPGTESSIHGWQAEAAVYASGHFSGGFSGLVSLGVLRPYGGGALQFIVSVAPAFGAKVGSNGS